MLNGREIQIQPAPNPALIRKDALFCIAGSIICFALAWIFSISLQKAGPPVSIRPEYSIAKQVQYGFTLQNKTNRVIPKVELWTYAPLKRNATQLSTDLKCNHRFELIEDAAGNRLLHFSFENLPPYAGRIISIKADLLHSTHTNKNTATPLPSDRLPQAFIESDHADILAMAQQLKTANTLKTAEAIFNWVSSNIRYTGYTGQDRGARYALTHKKGDCTEYMYLFVALCRASGIPARAIGGYICPESTVLRASGYHNWAEFYYNDAWHLADPQNRIFMSNQTDYVAMRVIRSAQDNPMGNFSRFRVQGEGLKVKMN